MQLRAFIQRYPNTSHIAVSAGAALFGLTMTPSFVPVVFILAALLSYAPVLFHRPHRYRYLALLWFSISLCSSVGRLIPALNALSTAGPSVAVLLGISAFASAIAILATFVDVFVSSRTGTAQVALIFPAVWTTLWAAVSHLPLGRLTSWSPMSGTQAYQWMAPWTGPAGVDWVTAAWAVVISQTIGIWYMRTEEDEIPATGSKRTSRSARPLVLAVILTALTIPSFIFPGTPLPVVASKTVSSVTVGCILPSKPSPELQDYVDESITLSSHHKGSKLLLWPEGAVSFRDTVERDVAFKKIQNRLGGSSGTYLGVSFEEFGASGSRTGIAIISLAAEPHMIYYKRFLVPIAESFRLTPGTSPPLNVTLPLNPKKPKQTIDVTASICLDFAMPSPFEHLSSRPDLILAPARTWDMAIGNRMWEEVKQRANEVGSLALWCDGGKEGVSGVAGAGYNDFQQVGAGSWSRAVGIPYPSNPTRTVYACGGDASIVIVAWVIVLGASFGPIAFRMLAARSENSRAHLRAVMTGLYNRVIGWRRQQAGTADGNLIDWGSQDTRVPFFHTNCLLTEEEHCVQGPHEKLAAVLHTALPVCYGCHTDLRHPTTGQGPLLLSRSARRQYGPVSSTRSTPSDPVQKPFVSPSLGSFQFITSDDLPIRLDDSPELKTSSTKPPATPTYRPPRVTFIGSFLHHLRRLKSFAAKSFHRRHSRHDQCIPIAQKVDESNARRDNSLPPRVYHRVNACELAASASSSLFESEPTPSTRTESSAPPSPSWLSLNLEDTTPTPNSEEEPSPALPPPDVSADPLEPIAPLTAHSSHSKENLSVPSSPKSNPSVYKADAHPTAKPPLTSSNTPNLLSVHSSVPDLEPDLSPIPNDSVNMDFTGKQAAEVVDFGGEVDYTNYHWFQDAPPKQPPPPQTVGTPYVPLPGVIEQNEAFEFALSAAPNVLYARYKQYGQLGVLAWCSEFGELIDNLKDLGFKGNMFVATRTQALRTCEDLLRLTKESLDLKMQIIVMYLSSQVARLRRFLDGDKTWDDYPEPQFPDYKKYSNIAGEFA
ncbi:hypothetical protein K438DRAFT_1748801 [Mycena galopus ATCC 62051]|nr:hypothetical protein K438DRAFT_1748801 [Mycena galopus ATCC 62051]